MEVIKLSRELSKTETGEKFVNIEAIVLGNLAVHVALHCTRMEGDLAVPYTEHDAKTRGFDALVWTLTMLPGGRSMGMQMYRSQDDALVVMAEVVERLNYEGLESRSPKAIGDFGTQFFALVDKLVADGLIEKPLPRWAKH